MLADPVLSHSTDSTNEITSEKCLTVDQIAAQSHLTKCCGDIQRWEDVFRVSVSMDFLIYISVQSYIVNDVICVRIKLQS